jgi:hypothetical protein
MARTIENNSFENLYARIMRSYIKQNLVYKVNLPKDKCSADTFIKRKPNGDVI